MSQPTPSPAIWTPTARKRFPPRWTSSSPRSAAGGGSAGTGNSSSAQWRPPTASEGDASLTIKNAAVLSYGEAVLDKRYWSMTLQHYTTPPDTATTNRQDTDIRDLDPSALEGGTIATAIVGSTDATTVRDRLWDLFSVERQIATVTVKAQPLQVRLHQQVRLKRDRFGIDANFRVVGFSEDYGKSQVTMELFR